MPSETAPELPALLTRRMIIAHFVPLGARTLDRWISIGQFPRPDISIGGKTRLWRIETIRRWIEAQAAEGGQRR